jgi:hypothetical protein
MEGRTAPRRLRCGRIIFCPTAAFDRAQYHTCTVYTARVTFHCKCCAWYVARVPLMLHAKCRVFCGRPGMERYMATVSMVLAAPNDLIASPVLKPAALAGDLAET